MNEDLFLHKIGVFITYQDGICIYQDINELWMKR